MAVPEEVAEDHERTFTEIPRFLSLDSKKHAYLLVLAGPQFGQIFPVQAGRELLLGRREDADLQITDEGVSRRHATLRVEGEGAIVTDQGSANGTYVDGARITQARIRDGARIQVGRQTTLKFIWADELDARYQVRIAQGALQDPLTGLYNRRHFDDRLAAELAAARRHGRALSLLMIDVDHFKLVNDQHGHVAGDETLRMVAAVLRDAVRREDVLARFGGEEFVVLTRETAIGGARALAERIRQAIERSRCAWHSRDGGDAPVHIGVTVSIGAAQYSQGDIERDLLDAADRALYLAKERGRNRVETFAAPAR